MYAPGGSGRGCPPSRSRCRRSHVGTAVCWVDGFNCSDAVKSGIWRNLVGGALYHDAAPPRMSPVASRATAEVTTAWATLTADLRGWRAKARHQPGSRFMWLDLRRRTRRDSREMECPWRAEMSRRSPPGGTAESRHPPLGLGLRARVAGNDTPGVRCGFGRPKRANPVVHLRLEFDGVMNPSIRNGPEGMTDSLADAAWGGGGGGAALLRKANGGANWPPVRPAQNQDRCPPSRARRSPCDRPRPACCPAAGARHRRSSVRAGSRGLRPGRWPTGRNVRPLRRATRSCRSGGAWTRSR